jgi:hypothetical protein
MRPHKQSILLVCLWVVLSGATNAEESLLQIVNWTAAGTTVVRFSFGKFKELSSLGKQHVYATEVTAQNLWTKPISRATFTLYVFDKAKVRIGEGFISISELTPAGIVKFQTTILASGDITSMQLAPEWLPPELQPVQPLLPPRAISITVNSVPQGAEVKMDGAAVGTTPKIVQVLPGKHTLVFSKEGFNAGTFPLEITPNDVSGGSVSFELGVSGHDTLELRDGSILSGDVQSMSATEVFSCVGGAIENINRNQVKRIVLIQRDVPQ